MLSVVRNFFFLVCCMHASAVCAAVSLLDQKGHIARFSSIQPAIDQAKAGDVIRIGSGVYRETLQVAGKRASSKLPLVIEAEPGANVVLTSALRLDGSDLRWRKIAEGLWELPLEWKGERRHSFLSWSFSSSGRLYPSYHDLDALRAQRRGPGVVRTETSVFYGTADPCGLKCLDIFVPVAEAAVSVRDSSGVEIRNITVDGGGYAGIYLAPDVSSVILEKLTVVNTFKGILVEGDEKKRPSEILVADSYVLNGWNFDWPWNEGYLDAKGGPGEDGGPMRGAGVEVIADNSAVRGIVVDGQWDGVRVQGRNVQVFNNMVRNAMDDGVELESGISQNLRFFSNFFSDCYVGISVGSNAPGPVYVYDNWVFADRQVISGGSRRNGYPLKFGVDWGPGIKGLYIYANSFFSNGRSVFVKTNASHALKWKDVVLARNLFVSPVKGALGFEDFGADEDAVSVVDNRFTDERVPERLRELRPSAPSPGSVVAWASSLPVGDALSRIVFSRELRKEKSSGKFPRDCGLVQQVGACMTGTAHRTSEVLHPFWNGELKVGR